MVLGTVLMVAAALVGLAALRALRPLFSPEGDRTAMVGERTRAALEREKLLTLRAIKELEFDRAMGKLSDDDFQEMSTRLRARAARLMRQLDAAPAIAIRSRRISRSASATLGEGRHRAQSREAYAGRTHEVPRRERSAMASASANRARRRTTRMRDSASHAGRSCERGWMSGKGRRGRTALLCLLTALCASSSVVRAQFQMPDPKEMAGIPRPVTDLPDKSVSVRLIRGELSNNIANHPVELHVGSKVTTVKTDENGRAQFDALAPGTSVKAVAVVDGERLESQEFPVPAQGGVRLMLVATDTAKPPATTPDAPPIAGQVVLGPQSRIVVEPADEAVNVFYLLDISNTSRAPVNPPAPFVFDLPGGRQQCRHHAGLVAAGERQWTARHRGRTVSAGLDVRAGGVRDAAGRRLGRLSRKRFRRPSSSWP